MLNQFHLKRHLPRYAAGLLILVCTNIAVSPLANAESSDGQTSTKRFIQGEVKHDERLPSLPDAYQVGTQFDQTELNGLTPDNIWFQIPSWLAGKWHSDKKIVEYVEDCKTGSNFSPHSSMKQVGDTVHGQQRDKTGQIWEYIKIPRTQTVMVPQGTAYLRALREDVLSSDSDQVMLKILTNQVTVDDRKSTIVDSNQVQQIGTYRPLDNDLVQLEASVKNFDGAGNPIQLQKSSALMKRTAPYEDVNTQDGQDLKKLFVEFLKKTGRDDLIPTAS